MAPGKNHKAEGEFDAADKNHKAKVEGSLTARVVSAAAKRAKLACRRHKRSAFKEKGGLVYCNNENRGSVLQRDKNLLWLSAIKIDVLRGKWLPTPREA